MCSDDNIIYACENSKTMSKACVLTGLHFNTFKRRAVKLGCYRPNQAGVGIHKDHSNRFIPLLEILDGLHPSYQTNKLRKRLLSEGIFEKKCHICGITHWNGMDLSFELEHIDGNRFNHLLENLMILCPNCHSQTSTYRGRNIK